MIPLTFLRLCGGALAFCNYILSSMECGELEYWDMDNHLKVFSDEVMLRYKSCKQKKLQSTKYFHKEQKNKTKTNTKPKKITRFFIEIFHPTVIASRRKVLVM